jgi:hypothetical protein
LLLFWFFIFKNYTFGPIGPPPRCQNRVHMCASFGCFWDPHHHTWALSHGHKSFEHKVMMPKKKTNPDFAPAKCWSSHSGAHAKRCLLQVSPSLLVRRGLNWGAELII